MKIKIEDTTYIVPESYSDITLADYEEWYDITVDTVDDRIRLVSKISKIPYDLLMDVPASLFSTILNTVSFAFKDGMNGIEPKNHIVIDGVLYTINFKDELTLAEWVDIEFVMEQEKNKLSELLAVICRPVNEKYNSKNNSNRIEMFKKLTLDELFPLFAFFLQLNEKFKMITDLCLKVDQVRLEVERLSHSQKNGGGMQRSAIWHKITSYKLIQWLKRQWLKCSIFLVIKLIKIMPKKKNINSNNK